jgi:hypothetical protein
MGVRWPRIAATAAILLAVYVSTLFLVHLLASSGPRLPPLDLDKFRADDTVVQIHVDDLKTSTNRLAVQVIVWPRDSYLDKHGTLTTDIAVRLTPNNDVGDLRYPRGRALAQVPTTIIAHGDPTHWPFGTYRTDVISGLVFAGVPYGDPVPAHIEVTGDVDGFDVGVTRVGPDDVVITLDRSRGPLIFDFGLCLVLISLPVLALTVAIPTALGRTPFTPWFASFVCAMLFSVVPLRNFFPGGPPPGSVVDQALVLWVLLALVSAMGLFVVAWIRQREWWPPPRPHDEED